MSFSSYSLSLTKMFFFKVKIIKIVKRRRKSNVKILSLGLNMRLYNRLDKEVIDFIEYKEGLITPHDTKYSHLRAGILQE